MVRPGSGRWPRAVLTRPAIGHDASMSDQGVHGSEPGDESEERQESDIETWTEETETGGEAAS